MLARFHIAQKMLARFLMLELVNAIMTTWAVYNKVSCCPLIFASRMSTQDRKGMRRKSITPKMNWYLNKLFPFVKNKRSNKEEAVCGFCFLPPAWIFKYFRSCFAACCHPSSFWVLSVIISQHEKQKLCKTSQPDVIFFHFIMRKLAEHWGTHDLFNFWRWWTWPKYGSYPHQSSMCT